MRRFFKNCYIRILLCTCILISSQCKKKSGANFDAGPGPVNPSSENQSCDDQKGEDCQKQPSTAWFEISIQGFEAYKEKYLLSLQIVPIETWDITGDQSFKSAPLAVGSEFEIKISSSPSHPIYQEIGLSCTTAAELRGKVNASGPIPLEISCSPEQQEKNSQIKVQITGLNTLGTDSVLTIKNQKGGQLVSKDDGTFEIPTQYKDQETYDISFALFSIHSSEGANCTAKTALTGVFNTNQTTTLKLHCEVVSEPSKEPAKQNDPSQTNLQVKVSGFDQISHGMSLKLKLSPQNQTTEAEIIELNMASDGSKEYEVLALIGDTYKVSLQKTILNQLVEPYDPYCETQKDIFMLATQNHLEIKCGTTIPLPNSK